MMNSLREDPKYLQFRRNFHFNLQGYQSVEFQQPFDVTGCIGLGNDAKINKTIYDKQDIMMKWFYRKKSGEHEIKNGIITIGKKGIISRFTKREVIHLLGGLNIVKGMATAVSYTHLTLPTIYSV